jgi:hypothetical protein
MAPHCAFCGSAKAPFTRSRVCSERSCPLTAGLLVWGRMARHVALGP